MTEDQPATPDPAGAPDSSPSAGRPSGHRPGVVPLHRSVADGELKDAWSLTEYFASLNNVMRLPSRARRPQAAAAGQPGARRRGWIGPVLLLAMTAVVIMVGGGIIRAVARSGVVELRPAIGVWEADVGPYAGRVVELTETGIAFRNGAGSTDGTWYRITAVTGKAHADSTLYTVIYDAQGRESEFSFWYVNGPRPLIRLRNRPGIAWYRSARPATPHRNP